MESRIVQRFVEGVSAEPAGGLLWPGTWNERAAEMLRIDLEAAGIPYIDDSGQVADFHAHRHTYITVAGRNLSPKMAKALARHSDYKLTERCTHLELHDTATAAAPLPPVFKGGKDKQSERQQQALRATGTDDSLATSLPPPCQNPRTGVNLWHLEILGRPKTRTIVPLCCWP